MTSHPPYPDKFKAGDTAVSSIRINFIDGTKHIIGQRIVVTEATKAFYNVWHDYYEKLEDKK